MKRGAFALVAIIVLAAACQNSSSKPTATPAPATTTSTTAPGCARPHAPGQSAQTFDFREKQRTYQLYVPKGYDGATALPVVFNFHGFGSNAVQQMLYGNFAPIADREGFLIVACVDPKRVYSTGMSDGGAMTSVLACRTPDRFAAFAAVAVVLYFPGCATDRAVAMMGVSGTEDAVVPYNGGRVNCCGNPSLPGKPAVMADWNAHDGCAAKFTDTRVGTDVVRRTWSRCKPGSAAVFYIDEGGGHTWPGAIPIARLGKTTDELDASQTIWDFFKAQQLQ